MDNTIKNWICNSSKCCYKWRSFCSSVGVVYNGIKPSEIISASKEQYQNCKILRKFIEFRIVIHNPNKLRLFIFNKNALENSLNNKHVLKQLIRLGYPKDFDIDSYVDLLISRIKDGDEFPHEIGFFLGYPVKDVLGFMEVINLPHTKTLGWKMYGNTKSSENFYYKVTEAKDEIRDYVSEVHNLAF